MPDPDVPEVSDDDELEFMFFPKMPLELRDNVWKHTIIPRLVHWRPGGGKALGVFSANKESRKATRTKYILCHVPFHRHGQYSIFINFNIDTVYRHQQGLPNMVRQYNFPCEAIDIPSGLNTSKVIKADLFWNVQPWIPFIKTLTIDLEAAAMSNRRAHPQVYGATQPVAAGQSIWVKIKCMCPDLEELNILVGKLLDKGVKLEDLAVIRDFAELEEEDDAFHARSMRAFVKAIREEYQTLQDKGDFLGLKLAFVKQIRSGEAKKQAATGILTADDARPGATVEDWDNADEQFDVSAGE
ncbi:hypothetical protein ONS95_000529 [Cadophora gregata]|uniref:uncharacterized protein n=1 Tax=Cadophora gregata TaxID=51156 RepID=UPI0026DB8C89|nr:uncharacterized protein ONS95_000529 [Cadophora gregata]KAK0125458.1 hypothetical protein ONS96_009299 [Cadophora gregata f. sp. sojae]KAK0128565.1 hypothetical protein ONS95_000529 [Cadophora gregata]